MGKCVVCEKEPRKVLFKDAIVKTYLCSEECLKAYFKPIKGYTPKIQKKLNDEDEGWLD